MCDVKYWIWLSLCVPAGDKCSDILLHAFDFDAKSVYDASEDIYDNIENLTEKVKDALRNKSLDEAEEIQEYCMINNIGLLPYDSNLYPSRLKRIEKAPLLLYYRGVLIDIDDNVEISAVGTRRYTEYGKREAYKICHDVAYCGGIIVSGMARGIDSICHRAALDAGGKTIAVLGCGIDKVYPPENEELMNEIIRNGVVFSEFRPHTDPIGQNFPIRNRIISGLSLGTLIIEADHKSGAMITARYALKQGRDIFALPGKVGDVNSQGTNELIQKGAKMVQNAEDILTEYEFFYPHRISIDILPKFTKFILNPVKNKPKLDSEDKKLVYAAEGEAKSKRTRADINKSVESQLIPPSVEKTEEKIDYSGFGLKEEQLNILMSMQIGIETEPDSIARSGIPASKVMSALTILEIKKLVSKVAGNKFVRIK